MTRREELLALAGRLSACTEDARRDAPVYDNPSFTLRQPASVISLCNAIDHIAAALRALAEQEGLER